MTFNFTPIGSPPPDPAYIRFLESFKLLRTDNLGYRWNAKSEKWFTYKSSDWIFEDLDLADTPAGYALTMKTYWEVNEYYVPELFKKLQKVAELYMKRFPHADLVWVPWNGGNWRNAIRKVTGAAVPKPWDPEKGTSHGDTDIDKTGPGDSGDYPRV